MRMLIKYLVLIFLLITGQVVNSIETRELSPILVHDLWGYQTLDKQVAIKPKYKIAHEFSEGVAVVSDKTQRIRVTMSVPQYSTEVPIYGFINEKGEWVVTPKYFAAQNFQDGLAAVLLNYEGKWGYINKSNQFVITPKFNYALSFSEDLAAVEIGGSFEDGSSIEGAYVGGKWGFINKNGNYVVKPQYQNAGSFNAGLAPVQVGSLWGYIDKKNKLRIKPQFSLALSFSEGKAAVCIKNKWGFIDKTGTLVIPAIYDTALNFSEGFAAVFKNSSWGFINQRGELAIPLQYSRVNSFKYGQAFVQIGGRYSIKNKITGELNGNFDLVEPYFEGLAAARVNELWGYIDPQGTWIIEPQFSSYRNFSKGFAEVFFPSKPDNYYYFGILDTSKRSFWKNDFRGYLKQDDSHYEREKENIINAKGEKLLNFPFEDIPLKHSFQSMS